MNDSSLSRLYAMLAPGRFLYEDAQYFMAEVEIDERRAKRWVPWPLVLEKPARATIFTGFFPKNTFGSVYHEAGIFLHVRHAGVRAIFSPWMLVDDDVALITGRELLGYPKKLGEISFSIEGDRIRGVASRRGTRLIEMSGTLGRAIAEPPPMLGRPHRNVRASMGLAMAKVIAFTPHEVPVEVREVDLDLQVFGSERDPLDDLGIGRVIASRLHRVNIGARGLPLPLHAVSPVWHVKNWLLRAH